MIVLNDKILTARRQCRCYFCNEPINIGEKYNRQVGVNGDFYTIKTHLKCYAISIKLDMYYDCSDEGLDSGTWYEYINERYKLLNGYDNLPPFKDRLDFICKYYLEDIVPTQPLTTNL